MPPHSRWHCNVHCQVGEICQAFARPQEPLIWWIRAGHNKKHHRNTPSWEVGDSPYRVGFPQDSVQLVNRSGWIQWFMVDITIVFMGIIMVYKPTYNWGAPSCMYIWIYIYIRICECKPLFIFLNVWMNYTNLTAMALQISKGNHPPKWPYSVGGNHTQSVKYCKFSTYLGIHVQCYGQAYQSHLNNILFNARAKWSHIYLPYGPMDPSAFLGSDWGYILGL